MKIVSGKNGKFTFSKSINPNAGGWTKTEH